MLKARKKAARNEWVFPGKLEAAPILGTYLDHLHDDGRESLKLPKDFVIHSLRHTMLARLGEAGADFHDQENRRAQLGGGEPALRASDARRPGAGVRTAAGF